MVPAGLTVKLLKVNSSLPVIEISAIILAAGESSRMGSSPKANLKIKNRTFLEIISRLYINNGINNVYTIVGHHKDRIIEENSNSNIKFIENAEYKTGQLSSIITGINAIKDSFQAAVIHPVDHPLVRKDTVKKLLVSIQNYTPAIVVPGFNNRRGHPVIFGKKVYNEILNASPEKGAREVVRKDPDRVKEITVDDPGVITNINTIEDYSKINNDNFE